MGEPLHNGRNRNIAVWVVSGLSIAVVVFLILTVFDAKKEKATAATCLSELKQIGLASEMYAEIYGGRTPWDGTPARGSPLGSFKLLSNTTDSATILHCPSDGRQKAKKRAQFAKVTTQNVSYSMVPGLMWQSQDSDSIVALDRIYTGSTSAGSDFTRIADPNHKVGGRIFGGNILYNDGRVIFSATLPSALKDQNGKPGVLTP